jgi:peptidylprolyl isomerase
MEPSLPLFVVRFSVRIRPLAALSVAALSALLLAGCSSASPDSSPTPSTTGGADLCSAQAPSGAASEAVKVEGETGKPATVTFTSPLEVPELQSTVVTEGSGDPVEAGDLVSIALSAYDAESGKQLGAIGYDGQSLLPQQISADNPLAQLLGCATPGTRVVATFPATESAAAQVYVVDLLDVVPNAAWGEPQAPVDGMPTVKLADDGVEEGVGSASGVADPEQPASRRADTAATDRAASGRMRTEQPRVMGRRTSIFSYLCSVRAEKRLCRYRNAIGSTLDG